MNWSGFFQSTVGKSVAALICGVAVWFLVAVVVSDIPCRVAKPPPPTFFPGPTFDLSPPGPPTTSEGCKTYGRFFLLPADNAPFILGFLVGVATLLGEIAYKKRQENKEIPRPQRPAPRDE